MSNLGFNDTRGLGGPSLMGQSSINQRPGYTGTGSRKMGDQNQHNPVANSRRGPGGNPGKNPLGSPGQKRTK